jgi:hypothetical protein
VSNQGATSLEILNETFLFMLTKLKNILDKGREFDYIYVLYFFLLYE